MVDFLYALNDRAGSMRKTFIRDLRESKPEIILDLSQPDPVLKLDNQPAIAYPELAALLNSDYVALPMKGAPKGIVQAYRRKSE